MDYFFYNTDASAIIDAPKPRYHVLFDGNFAAVGGDRQHFGEQLAQLAPGDIIFMYENEVGVVGLGRVLERWDGRSHQTLRYYTPSEMSRFDGGPNEYRIGIAWVLKLDDSPIRIDQLREELGYTPRGAISRIVEKKVEAARMVEELRTRLHLVLGEVDESSTLLDGAPKQALVTVYERNREAVKQCKAVHGTKCAVCGLDFGETYGSEFAGFIHVHHLRPLSEIRAESIIVPVTDLRPVCPNCHAIIHYGGNLRSVEEVRGLLKRQRKAKEPM